MKGVSTTINGGYNGIKDRNEYIKNARTDDAFKVFIHYQNIYNNGSSVNKQIALKNLRLLNQSRTIKNPSNKKEMIEFKDDNAKSLYDKLKKSEEETAKKVSKKEIGDKIDAKDSMNKKVP